MNSEHDYWIEDAGESGTEDSFRPGTSGIIVRIVMLALLLWTLIQLILPRRSLNLRRHQFPNPPAEPIEPTYWL